MSEQGGTRERMLGRVRAAIGGGRRPEADIAAEYAALHRGYLRAHHDPAEHDVVTLFAERAADYRAVVEQASATELAGVVARVLAGRAAQAAREGTGGLAGGGGLAARDGGGASGGGVDAGRSGSVETASGGVWFAVPPGLPGEWLPAADPGIRLVVDDPPLPVAELDRCAGVITGCGVAIAETGTIVLDHGPGQGRRALTLVPDFHLVVVRHGQIAPDLPDAVARMDPARPQTLIAGPSATSDIELIRVEGVHGPRHLHVLIVP